MGIQEFLSHYLSANTYIAYSQLFLIFTGVSAFVALFFKAAPYGRHYEKKEARLFTVNDRLAWRIFESPTLIISVYYAFYYFDSLPVGNLVLIGFYIFHYIYRVVIFPFSIPKDTYKHPEYIALLGVLFNIVNAYMLSYSILFEVDFPQLDKALMGLGVGMFVSGLCVNAYHDRTLLKMKEANKGQYVNPQFGLFRYVVNPNYLGEFIEWSGFFLICQHFSCFVFAMFTFCNLFPRSLSNRRWYIAKFGKEAESKKAFFPFLV